MATADLGQLGPRESDPQFINWSIWSIWSLTQSLPWLMLIVLLATRPNRRLAAWAVILPLAAVVTISSLLNQVLLFSESFLMQRQSVPVLALALAGLWLISPWLGRSSRFITFVLAVLLTVACAAMFPVLDSGIYLDEEVAATMEITVLAATAMVLGLAVNAFWCRRRPGDRSFLLWLLPWTWVASFLLFYAAISLNPVYSEGYEGVAIIYCMLHGLVLYLVLLPFVALALRSEFYRRRLYACTRLPWLAADDESPTVPETLLPETMREFDGESP